MKILVIGSLNIDYNYYVNEFPKPGETIDAVLFSSRIGGKGINQAYAASQIMETTFIGKVNSADVDSLKQEINPNKNLRLELVKSNSNTGNAAILINAQGENNIIISHGANYEFNKNDYESIKNVIDDYDGILLQEEINEDFLFSLISLAKSKHKLICLNPAPFHKYTSEIVNNVDIITPNETEFESLFGFKFSFNKIEDTQASIRGEINLIVVTLGEVGAVAISKNDYTFVEAYKVKAIDTVGAGDTFNGFFFANYLLTRNIKDSLKLANKASSIAVSRKGTLKAVPTLDECAKY